MKYLYTILILSLLSSTILSNPILRERRALKNFSGSSNDLGIFSKMGLSSGISGSNFKLANFGASQDVPESRAGRRRRNVVEISVASGIVDIEDDKDDWLDPGVTPSLDLVKKCVGIYGRDSPLCKAMRCELDNVDCATEEEDSQAMSDMCNARHAHRGNLLYCKLWKCEQEFEKGDPRCQIGYMSTPTKAQKALETTTPALDANSCEHLFGKGSKICVVINCRRQKGADHPDCKSVPTTTVSPRAITGTYSEIPVHEVLYVRNVESGTAVMNTLSSIKEPSTTMTSAVEDFEGNATTENTSSPKEDILTTTSGVQDVAVAECYTKYGEGHESCQKIKCEQQYGIGHTFCEVALETTTLSLEDEEFKQLMKACEMRYSAEHEICEQMRCRRVRGPEHPDCQRSTTATTESTSTTVYLLDTPTSVSEAPTDNSDSLGECGDADSEECVKKQCEQQHGVGDPMCVTPGVFDRKIAACEMAYGADNDYCVQLKCQKLKGTNDSDCQNESTVASTVKTESPVSTSEKPTTVVESSLLEDCIEEFEEGNEKCVKIRCEQQHGSGSPRCATPVSEIDGAVWNRQIAACERAYGADDVYCVQLKCKKEMGSKHSDCDLNNVLSTFMSNKDAMSTGTPSETFTTPSIEHIRDVDVKECYDNYGIDHKMCQKLLCQQQFGIGNRNCETTSQFPTATTDMTNIQNMEHPVVRECQRKYGNTDKSCQRIKCELQYGIGSPNCLPSSSETEPSSYPTEIPSVITHTMHIPTEHPVVKECNEQYGEHHKSCQRIKCELQYGVGSPNCRLSTPGVGTSSFTTELPIYQTTEFPREHPAVIECFKNYGKIHKSCQRIKCELQYGVGSPNCRLSTPGTTTSSYTTKLPIYQTTEPPTEHPVVLECFRNYGKTQKSCQRIKCELQYGVGSINCPLSHSDITTLRPTIKTPSETISYTTPIRYTKDIVVKRCYRRYGKNNAKCQKLLCEQQHGIGSLHCRHSSSGIPFMYSTTKFPNEVSQTVNLQYPKYTSVYECYQTYGKHHRRCQEVICEQQHGVGSSICQMIVSTTPTSTSTTKIPSLLYPNPIVRYTKDVLVKECYTKYGKNHRICQKLRCEHLYGIGNSICEVRVSGISPSSSTTKTPSNFNQKVQYTKDIDVKECYRNYGSHHIKCKNLACEQQYGIGSPNCRTESSGTTIFNTKAPVGVAPIHTVLYTKDIDVKECYRTYGTYHTRCQKLRCEQQYGIGSPNCGLSGEQDVINKRYSTCVAVYGLGHSYCQSLNGGITTTQAPIRRPQTTRSPLDRLAQCYLNYGRYHNYCQKLQCDGQYGTGHPKCAAIHSSAGISQGYVSSQKIKACELTYGVGDEYCVQLRCKKEKGPGHPDCQPQTVAQPTSPIYATGSKCAQIYGPNNEYCKQLLCQQTYGVRHPNCLSKRSQDSPTCEEIYGVGHQNCQHTSSFESCLHMGSSFDTLVSCQRARCENLKGKGHSHCQFPFPSSYSEVRAVYYELKNCEFTYGSNSPNCARFTCKILNGANTEQCRRIPKSNSEYQITTESCDIIYGKFNSFCQKLKCEKVKGVGSPDCQQGSILS